MFVARVKYGVSLGLALVAIAGLGCSKDSTGPVAVEPGNGTAVNLKGTLANASLSGDIDITIAGTATSGVAAVTGCVYLRTATCVSAPGTYTVASKALSFGTASPALAFTGTYSGGVVQGAFTGTSGAGVFTVRDGTVSVYCGTFAGAASGRWNFVIDGSTLDGLYNDGSGNYRLTGTVSGNSLSITYAAGTATGTLSGATASGSWSAGGGSGTWTGSNSGCRS